MIIKFISIDFSLKLIFFPPSNSSLASFLYYCPPFEKKSTPNACKSRQPSFQLFEDKMMFCFIYIHFFILLIGGARAQPFNHSVDLSKRAQSVEIQCPIPGSFPFMREAYFDALQAVSLNNASKTFIKETSKRKKIKK